MICDRLRLIAFKALHFAQVMSPLYLFLRVLRVLRGQTVCHHEEHEGHEVWMPCRAETRGMFLFIVVSRQTKRLILCVLCGSTVLTTLSLIEGRLCGE